MTTEKPTPIRCDRPDCRCDRDDEEIRWLALLLRQSALMIAKGIERRYGIGDYKDHQKRDAA